MAAVYDEATAGGGMKLLMIGPSAVIAMRRVVNWALAAGHEVCLLDSQNPFKAAMPPNLRFVPFQVDYDLNMVKTGVFTQAGQAELESGARQIEAIMRDFQPDLIHAHHLLLPTVCCLRAGFGPLIVSAWGTLNGLLSGHPLTDATAASLELLQKADAVVVESPALYQACQNWGGLKRLSLIPLGTNTTAFRPNNQAQRVSWRRALDVAADTTVLLSPRGWSRVYNQAQILQAFALAYPHFARPTLLVFVQMARSASDIAVSYIDQTHALARELGLSDAIRWLPELTYELMPSLYAFADIVVNYPLSDAFPSTLVEASACGLPLISASLPSYQDTFIARYGVLVEPQNPTALSAAMRTVVNNPATVQQERLQQARQEIVAEFDEVKFQRAMFALYEQVSAGLDKL